METDWDDRKQLSLWRVRNITSYQPSTVTMSFMHEYAEPNDWVVTQFKDWAYMLTCCYFYYKEGKLNDLRTILALQEGMAAFGGVYPNYYLILRNKPTISWEFHSLQQFIQLMLSFMLSDEKNPLRLCKYCHHAYFLKEDDSWFCSEACKHKYTANVSNFDLKEFIGDEW